MDQDGDIDIVAVGRNSIAWFENEDGRGSFSQKHAIAADVGAIVDLPGAAVADMDQDGDLDVLIARRSGASIIWYENNGQGRFENRHESPDMDTGPWRIVANDMDGDGDVDVVTSSYFDRRTTWFENIDGVGTLHERDISFPELGSFSPVAVADIDGDGDPDVITGEAGVVIGGSGKLSWFDNYDGKGSFDEAWILQTGVDFFGAVAAGDLDGDGDQDVIAAISGSIDFISWFENTDGLGTFSSENRLADLGFSLFFGTVWLEPVDVDQDGDLDVVVSNSLDRTIQWYENLDGAGNFGPDPHIISSEFPGASGLAAVDIDGDGDRDIVTPSTRGISWFRNDTRFDYNRDGAIDADDIDLLCGSLLAIEQDSRFDANDEGVVDRQDLSVLVHEVLGTDLGDANLDGSVDQLDLVQILQAGQYHDAIEDNSGWSAGDFNCDGDADQHDIIAVLKSGGFANAALAASTRLASHLKGATIRGQNWQLDATPENSQVQPDVVEIVDQLFAEDAGMARTHVKSQTRTFTEDDEFLGNVI